MHVCLWVAGDLPELHCVCAYPSMPTYNGKVTWMTISSPKNVYQLYKVMKKKVLQLQSVSFVLRSFIYQSIHYQLGHNSQVDFMLKVATSHFERKNTTILKSKHIS